MENAKLHVILTGATGMVGEGVLLETLEHPQVASVLVINRRPCGVEHPKLREMLHQDFLDLSAIEERLKGFDACFFCLGVSSLGMSKDAYFKTTYTLTMHVAKTLSRHNPGMTFCYISGAGTDGSEKGMIAWARVKGKTENDLMRLPFKAVFALRPGFIRPLKKQHHAHGFYRYIAWMFPIGRRLFPGSFCTMEELAKAFINLSLNGYEKKVLEGRDILKVAHVLD